MQKTEMRNENTMNIDKASTAEILRLIHNEDQHAVDAVTAALPAITRACDSIRAALENGGRLLYIGAGTSGRLGVLDAVECVPTFGVPPTLVVGILAGGHDCMFRASEREEDNGDSGVRDLKAVSLEKEDIVVGISASGNASYVGEALQYARSIGCVTVGISSNFGSRLDKESDISIVTETGAEAITGSTRMKAGSAQKMVLNMLSTCAMIQTGRVYSNLMINLRPTNDKLKRRVISIVREILGCDEETAVSALEQNGWDIRKTVENTKA